MIASLGLPVAACGATGTSSVASRIAPVDAANAAVQNTLRAASLRVVTVTRTALGSGTTMAIYQKPDLVDLNERLGPNDWTQYTGPTGEQAAQAKVLYPLLLISSASEITLIHGSEFSFHTIAKGGELSSLPMTVNGVFTISSGWITSIALTATN
jgi:hypothetical protein